MHTYLLNWWLCFYRYVKSGATSFRFPGHVCISYPWTYMGWSLTIFSHGMHPYRSLFGTNIQLQPGQWRLALPDVNKQQNCGQQIEVSKHLWRARVGGWVRRKGQRGYYTLCFKLRLSFNCVRNVNKALKCLFVVLRWKNPSWCLDFWSCSPDFSCTSNFTRSTP